MVVFCSRVSDFGDLLEKVELPFRVKEGVGFVEQGDAVAILEQLDNGIDVHRLELTVAEVGNGGVHPAGQLQGNGDLRQHPQYFQVVELAEQLLGAEVIEFLPDSGDIEIEDVTVLGSKILLGAHRLPVAVLMQPWSR